MENNELDRLFREKASDFQLDPTHASWEVVRANIENKKNHSLWLWRIAACLTGIAIVSYLLWSPVERQVAMKTVIADHPAHVLLDIQLIAPHRAPIVSRDHLEINRKESDVTMEIPDAGREAVSLFAMETLEIKSRKNLLATSQPDIGSIELNMPGKMAPPVVSIKYFAGEKANEKRGFGQLLAKAQTFNPGEFLGNLRAAKDEMIGAN